MASLFNVPYSELELVDIAAAETIAEKKQQKENQNLVNGL